LYDEKKKKLLFFIYILLSGTLLLTFSRGGYLGLLFGLAIFFFLSWQRMKISEKKFFVSLAFLAVVLMAVFGNLFIGRFVSIFNFSEGSNLGRLGIWQESISLVQKNPILGIGLGNYSLALNFNENYRNAVSSHNLYLDILTETGIIGLSAWALFFWNGFKDSLLGIKKKIKESFVLSLGIIGSLSYFLIHSFFETSIFNPTILSFLMVIMGLTVSLDKIKEKNVL
jgi:O-antigen ligase